MDNLLVRTRWQLSTFLNNTTVHYARRQRVIVAVKRYLSLHGVWRITELSYACPEAMPQLAQIIYALTNEPVKRPRFVRAKNRHITLMTKRLSS